MASTVTSTIVAVVMMMVVVAIMTVVVVTVTTAASASSTTSVGTFKGSGFFLGGHYKKGDRFSLEQVPRWISEHTKYQRTSRENTNDTDESNEEDGLHYLQRN